MGDIVSLFDKKSSEGEKEISIRDGMIKALKELGRDDLDAGIMLVMDKQGNTFSGFFNTSFRDEAVLSKVLDIDIFHRQCAREVQQDGE